jgi:hypothetical protein
LGGGETLLNLLQFMAALEDMFPVVGMDEIDWIRADDLIERLRGQKMSPPPDWQTPSCFHNG